MGDDNMTDGATVQESPAGQGNELAMQIAEADPCVPDADMLFEHLEELVTQLPRMRELDHRLARAGAAGAALVCARELEICETMFAEAEERVATAERALEEARRTGDAAAVDRCQRDVLYYCQQRGLRVGPVRNVRQSLERKLGDAGFSSIEEARSAILGETEQGELHAALRAYQRDYAATLAACQGLTD